ncbi:class I SAM-dependent methyltransferase [Bacillus sp. PS06]|uniref:class I SAM-dependent methyltransferase n=1 Tax=Bacillus sp. PS06 TaxID=2764176 RepID=UPI001785466A|nr:class I SAM-dependent methyltransferase [Bacillus sp. PS06]MBD8067830.1 class I SAM-dependent methyltransferase [Bacillus sp. PS06]
MTELEIKEIVDYMATSKVSYDVQLIQTKHRIKLVDFWGIKEGSNILEIGCGQGDTTAVLATYTGENGLVHGIDIGSPTYGSPITLGESAEYLLKSKVGKQIKIDFNTNILSAEIDFKEHSFDYIVFAHCSWYTKSRSELLDIMKKVRTWGKQLCFAEWNTQIKSTEQYPHLLSILIQAQYEAFKEDSDSNVRTLVTPSDVREIVEEAGWQIKKDTTIDSPDLHDGMWEVDKVLEDVHNELSLITNIPVKLKDLILSEVKMLEEFHRVSEMKPLSVYSFLAE